MKHNVKRSIIMTLIYGMGIGSLSLFVGALYPISYTNDLPKNEIKAVESIDVKDKVVPQKNNLSKQVNAAIKLLITPVPSPTPSPKPSPTPTPTPAYEFAKGEHPEIEKFFLDYYVAVNSCDYSIIQSLVTDPDNIKPLSELEKETLFLDDIRDINCYIIKGFEEGSYIVYVYHELKYVNIKTTYPKLDKFYLVTDKSGSFKIFTSEMDETLKAFYDGSDQDKKVMELIEETNNKAKEALDKDEDLRIYLEALNR